MRAASVALLLAIGCTAQVPDGRIGCHDPGRLCPATFTCWSDGLCRHGLEPDAAMRVDGGLDAFVPVNDAGTDAGLAGLDYQACGPGESCMPGATCYAHAYCAPPCITGMCPPSPPGTCSGPTCLLNCTIVPGSPDPCLAPSTCALGRWTAAGTTGVCADATALTPSHHGMGCSSDAMCTMPDSCVHGACVRACSAMGPCGGGENCAPVPTTAPEERACLSASCTPACAAGFECVTPTGAPGPSCFPLVWVVPGTRS